MTTLREQIRQSIPADKVVITCGREDDAAAWRALLDVRRCVAVALDTQMEGRPRELLTGASSYLTWQHDTIANIETDSWLARHVDRFDPDRKALLVIPDPFDPPQAGRRDRLGRRHPIARLLEDKTIVDTLWDSLGLKRARSIIADAGQDVATLGALVDGGTGVVCAIRPRAGGPTSGGDGIWWWRGSQPPEHMSAPASARMRLMPLLEGLPVRLHGLVLGSRVITFPPMEIIALPRPDRGTFLPAGEVPSALPHRAELVACTERIGAKLRSAVSYRGAFAVDGVLTDAGFLPTDLNARLTSAMEPAPPELRVQLHAVNLLARDGIELDPVAVQRLVTQTFRGDGSHTLYGAARNLRRDVQTRTRVRWNGNRLVAAEAGSDHGVITVNAALRT